MNISSDLEGIQNKPNDTYKYVLQIHKTKHVEKEQDHAEFASDKSTVNS